MERDQRKKQSLLKNKVNEDEQLMKALQVSVIGTVERKISMLQVFVKFMEGFAVFLWTQSPNISV